MKGIQKVYTNKEIDENSSDFFFSDIVQVVRFKVTNLLLSRYNFFAYTENNILNNRIKIIKTPCDLFVYLLI